jgi:hypothetical protein
MLAPANGRILLVVTLMSLFPLFLEHMRQSPGAIIVVKTDRSKMAGYARPCVCAWRRKGCCRVVLYPDHASADSHWWSSGIIPIAG